MTRAAAGLVLAAVVPVALAGCESSQSKSAKIAAEGDHLIAPTGPVRITAPNRDVKVAQAVVIRGRSQSAVAVELRNGSSRAAAAIPLLVDVRDRAGKSVYRNDLQGLQPALQRMALVRAGATAWWVNDQVVASAPPASVTARVGRSPSPASPPRVTATGVGFKGDSSGRFLHGKLVNHTATALKDVLVYAVALRGGKVRAAGRALVPKLPAKGAKKATMFDLYFVGDPAGAKVSVSVAPTIAAGSATS